MNSTEDKWTNNRQKKNNKKQHLSTWQTAHFRVPKVLLKRGLGTTSVFDLMVDELYCECEFKAAQFHSLQPKDASTWAVDVVWMIANKRPDGHLSSSIWHVFYSN